MGKITSSKILKLWALQTGEKLIIKKSRCNKGACKMCPHAFYAYAFLGYGKQRKSRYLGTCEAKGFPRQKYSTRLL